MHNIWNDLVFALRQLRRAPGFALTAILTLALGLGANTAIFSLLDQALLRALPVHDPASLIVLRDSGSSWLGVLAYSTSQRTREICIRTALGSSRFAVSSLILKDVLPVAAPGSVIALPTVYGLSVLVRSQLFGVSAADPSILLRSSCSFSLSPCCPDSFRLGAPQV